ncbi:MAG: hypothetical protein FWE94_06835, partial [Coriobacteriia bacterium]|nr:hypothetical protein [Coriobacteriia bacterium]
LAIVVIGGMGSIPGVIVGALFIQGVPELIRGAAQAGWLEVIGISLSGEAQSAISNYRYLVFGLLMVLMMALRPQGILPAKRRARELQVDNAAVGEAAAGQATPEP